MKRPPSRRMGVTSTIPFTGVKSSPGVTKSWMAWRPGFTPVSRLAQATGDSGGSSLRRGWKEPSRARAFKCGSSSASKYARRMRSSTPSNPSTTSRGWLAASAAGAGARRGRAEPSASARRKALAAAEATSKGRKRRFIVEAARMAPELPESNVPGRDPFPTSAAGLALARRLRAPLRADPRRLAPDLAAPLGTDRRVAGDRRLALHIRAQRQR